MIRRSQLLFAATLLCGLPAFAQDWSIEQDIDPAKVVGADACVKCHESEVAGWKLSSHYLKAHGLLEQKEAETIAKSMNVTDLMSDKRCTTCHGTQQEKDGQFSVITAVSCESCHGAAGGEPGWLDVHASYGKNGDTELTREEESKEDLVARLAKCDALGMRRSENLYALAKNCFECHIVSSEELVNDSKHPAGSETIEFVSWAQGEVRHNFRLDPKVNAVAPTLWTNSRLAEGRTEEGHRKLMYVVGQLADLEVSLRNRAKATGRGNFLTSINKRITDAQKELGKIAKSGPVPELDDLPTASRSQLRRAKDGDTERFNDLADKIEKIGMNIASTKNGNDWGDIGVPDNAKGDVYLGK